MPNPVRDLGVRMRKSSRTVNMHGGKVKAAELTQAHFEVDALPGTPFRNPILATDLDEFGHVTDDEKRIMYDPHVAGTDAKSRAVSNSAFTMRVAHPYRHLHFNPRETVVGIVTCGGLCPGLNDVVRGLTYTCIRTYGVKRVIGFRYGFWGMSAAGRDSAVVLDTTVVSSIHRRGGTFLGSSRGPQKPAEMVDTLRHYGINVLFTVGGDGTQRGAQTIGTEARKRGLDLAVVGVPKTIDNDLSFSHRTFGFETAVSQAVKAIRSAHSEASSHFHGVGVVKVMGRHSGFIAANAVVASHVANICLVPEQPITKATFFQLLASRLHVAKHCVVVVAEGFGQEWQQHGPTEFDASGNAKLIDSGVMIKNEIVSWLKQSFPDQEATVKYIDPSYMIRACPANTADAEFCVNLSTLAVHEAMRGTTNAIISCWYNNLIVVPISLATSLRRIIDLRGSLWRSVRQVTASAMSAEECCAEEKLALERRLDALDNERTSIQRMLSKL